jgi:Polysaccharide lyase
MTPIENRLRPFFLSILLPFFLAACVSDGGGTVGGTFSLKHYAETISIGHKNPWAYAEVSSPVRMGKSAQRFELRHGDCGGDADWNDCNTDRGRTEKIVVSQFDKIGQESWYGFSLYIDENLADIWPSNVTIFQWKATKWREPLANLGLHKGHLTLNMSSIQRDRCMIMPLYKMRNRWTDFVFHTRWSSSGGVIEFWIDGEKNRHPCSLDGRVISSKIPGGKKILPHWGLYQSYVSRWLAQKSRKPVVSKGWSDLHKDSGHVNQSIVNDPFKHDWGVELPTQVVYYDELRIGESRQAVDVRLIEARGEAPID